MKTAISIPDSVFDAADALAKRLRISRSELYSKAVSLFIANHGADEVTESLNRVYAEEDSLLDPVLEQLQAESLTTAD